LNTENFNWRINSQIRANKLRVIGPDGKMVGVMNLKEALELAIKLNLDLVEIAPTADPPVAKVVELGKFRYEEEKKLKNQKKGAKTSEVKEIRFSPFIGEADFNVRYMRVKEFLAEGNKVRTVVRFKGRQMGSKNFGYELLNRITSLLGDSINVDMPPKFIGRHLTMVISPLSGAKKNENEKSEQDQDKKNNN
jgi:translation initiation factor IF-3